MKGIVRIAAVAAALMLATAAGAGATELKEVVAALEQGYRGLNDVQADFVQRSAIAGIGREQKGSGELSFRLGAGAAKFRFDYRKPVPQQIISDGKTVWLYQPENRQVIVSDMEALMAGGSGLAVAYLTGLGEVTRDFTVSFAGDGRDKKGNYLLDLVPKKKNPVLSKLRLVVTQKALEADKSAGIFPVASATLFDSQGNRTALDFSRVRTNRGLPASLFIFHAPPGTEVVRPGK